MPLGRAVAHHRLTGEHARGPAYHGTGAAAHPPVWRLLPPGYGEPAPVSARKRRKLVESLRRLAQRALEPDDCFRHRQEALLPCRAGVVRTTLLEIADLLEQTDDPDPACCAELWELLTNGCDSPLYNAQVHDSELRATLYYIRAGLLARSLPVVPAPRTQSPR